MANYIFTNGTNSFTIKSGDQTQRYSRNYLRVKLFEGDDQLVEIWDTVKNYGLFKINLAVDTVNVDGTTVWADSTALDTALEPLFFLVSSGGGAPVSSSALAIISTGDWVVGGTSGYYFDFTHNLNTEELLYEARDTDLNKVIVLNQYMPQDANTVRIESTVNTINVAVLVSNGGASTVIDSLTVGSEETTDFAPVGKGGVIIPVNSATDVDVTINIGACLDGETVYFRQVGAGRIILVDGTLTGITYAYGSKISGGQGAVMGALRIGSEYKPLGDLQ